MADPSGAAIAASRASIHTPSSFVSQKACTPCFSVLPVSATKPRRGKVSPLSSSLPEASRLYLACGTRLKKAMGSEVAPSSFTPAKSLRSKGVTRSLRTRVMSSTRRKGPPSASTSSVQATVERRGISTWESKTEAGHEGASRPGTVRWRRAPFDSP